MKHMSIKIYVVKSKKTRDRKKSEKSQKIFEDKDKYIIKIINRVVEAKPVDLPGHASAATCIVGTVQ